MKGLKRGRTMLLRWGGGPVSSFGKDLRPAEADCRNTGAWRTGVESERPSDDGSVKS
jgi:hypothetical protein